MPGPSAAEPPLLAAAAPPGDALAPSRSFRTTGAPRRRILFFGEAVTLAHVARPVSLARSLDPSQFEVHLACDPRFNRLFGVLPGRFLPIRSIPCEQFLRALARGAPVYDAATLRDYVREDLQVIAEVAPDVVVGDFRLSLAVSAERAHVPYFAISNAYWSPYARLRFPLPELPLSRRLGVSAASLIFQLLRPAAFAYHTLPLNRVRREWGQASLGHDLRRLYTYADRTLYADVPQLVPTQGLPANHHYVGPILWSPEVPLPSWWGELPADRPVVYVTMGSSGKADLLRTVLAALEPIGVCVIAANAGRGRDANVPPNAFMAEYLPGEQAVARSQLVISNGGSPTTHQALVAGVPVIGIAGNLDQHLNMFCVERAGVGRLVRTEAAVERTIRKVAREMIESDKYRAQAAGIAKACSEYDARRIVSSLLARAVSPRC